jgi:antitoxin MazE
MTAKVVAIGNSRGIRIPNNILKSMKIDTEIDLVYNEEKEEILIRPVKKARQGWDDAFRKMNHSGDDKMLIHDSVDIDNGWEWQL